MIIYGMFALVSSYQATKTLFRLSVAVFVTKLKQEHKIWFT